MTPHQHHARDGGVRETDKLARLLRQFIYIFCIMALIAAFDAIFGPFAWLKKFDSTDAPGKRSNMQLYTDHLTGCQYLGARDSITPRLDRNGHIMCGGKQ